MKYFMGTISILMFSFIFLQGQDCYANQAPILYNPNPDSPIGEKNPNAAEELNQFAFLIGDWDVDITWLPEGKDPVKYQAKWHNRWIIDGFAVMQEWRGPYLTGTEIRYYNPKTKNWTGRNLYVNGEWKQTIAQQQGDKMIVTILDAKDNKGSFLNRETYFNITKDSHEMKSDRSYDNGKTWIQGKYYMTVKRSKK